LKAWSDQLIGAYSFAEREAPLSYVGAIPAPYNIGWDFMQWYAFSSVSKITERHDYLVVEPRTSITITGKDPAWTGTGIIAIHDRLCALLRQWAKTLGPSLDKPSAYLRPLGYIQQKLVGKKPVQGIFLEPELRLLNEEWQHRMEEIGKQYRALPNDWKAISQRTDGFSSYLATLNVRHSNAAREIMECGQRRVPQLLVTRKTKRETITQLAKGSTLSDKLREIGGGKSVRTIANVMHSPVSGMDKSFYIDLVMRVAKERFTRKGMALDGKMLSSMGFSTEQINSILPKGTWVEIAVSVYLEVIPERIEEEAWRLTWT
jgi:hypothetical protein